MSKAVEVVALLKRALDTQDALDRAIDNVPDYTGQYMPEDFYADELAERDEAAEKLLAVLDQALREAKWGRPKK